MSELPTFVPPNFLAMYDCNSVSENPSDALKRFVGTAGKEPTVTIRSVSFLLQVWSSHASDIAQDEKQEVTLVLYGEVFDNKGIRTSQSLLQEYLTYGLDTIAHFNGSFTILIADTRTDDFFLITDRLGSRRVFISNLDGSTWLSSDLRHHPIKSLKPDLVGVASFLANGAVYNNRTLFEDIKIMDRASIFSFGRNGIESKSYWSHVFTNEREGQGLANLTRELSSLLIQSIERRISSDDIPLVSLSGGWDSTTILGILVRHLKRPDVSCYTYTYGKPAKESDSYVAAQTAKSLNCKHRLIQSYNGDLLSFIKANALDNKGMTGICEDVHVWDEVHDEFVADPRQVLLAGEHCFGTSPYLRTIEIVDKKDALNSVGISDFNRFSWLAKLIDRKAYSSLKNGWTEELNHILNTCSHCSVINDYRDILYVSQRSRHLLTPWRHKIIGDHIRVCQPFLDNDVIDFMSGIPTNLRVNKVLFKETAKAMVPDLFDSLAKNRMAYPDWSREFDNHRAEIEQLSSGKSVIDDIVPHKAVIYWLRMNRRSLRLRSIERKYRGINRRLFKTVDKGYEKLKPVDMLQRVLALRMIFQEKEGI